MISNLHSIIQNLISESHFLLFDDLWVLLLLFILFILQSTAFHRFVQLGQSQYKQDKGSQQLCSKSPLDKVINL